MSDSPNKAEDLKESSLGYKSGSGRITPASKPVEKAEAEKMTDKYPDMPPASHKGDL